MTTLCAGEPAKGLVIAIASLNQALVARGALSHEEVDKALARAEQTALGDDRLTEDLSAAKRDAVVFPIRMLRMANGSDGETVPAFAELAKAVGMTKERYDDQR